MTPLATLLASIPSPSQGQIDVGPVSLHAYGLTLLVAIAAATALTGVRWTRRGGDWDLVLRVAVWGVAAGIVGARLYHVVTSWDEVPGEWWGVFAVWEGGLGVWGGIGLGTIVGAIVVRRAGESVVRFMDAVAPGLLLAQAIGRWGNWWNQELFGSPTDRPWGLEIDPDRRPPEYLEVETFHPVFLYESLYALAGVAVLLLVDRFFRIRPPALFALYVALYSIGRFFIEFLRIDRAHEWGPLRLNGWVALAFFLGGLAAFVWIQFVRERRQRRRRREAEVPKAPTMAVPKGRVRGSR
ncbi:MAG TPA: prolipoprotein diacylglyceryl transferase [Gaiellaceae bacterium]|nr:prolipoprotein diacylglyceryl transferase [Gaiellaceae bacterium]